LNGCQGGSAGGVGHKVWPGKIKDICHPSGNDVAQFAGHGILGNPGDSGIDAFPHSLEELFLNFGGKLFEGAALGKRLRIIRKMDAQGGPVMHFASHGISKDHRCSQRIHFTAGVAVIAQRLVGSRDCEFLRFIHDGGHPRWDGNSPLERVEHKIRDPGANFRVGFIDRSGVRVPIKLGIPAICRDLRDRVARILNICPKCLHIRRVWQDCASPNNGYRLITLHENLLVSCVFRFSSLVEAQMGACSSFSRWPLQPFCSGLAEVGLWNGSARICMDDSKPFARFVDCFQA